MTINITQLRAFLAVSDEGGFGAAAEVSQISQSAVSHAVAALEKSLGHRVLIRHGQPRPTAFGERILDHARAAITATDTIRALADQQDGRPTGILRLAAPPTICQGLLPGLLTRWRDEFPQLRIRVFEGEDDEVADWLASAIVDLAVLVDPPPGPGVQIGEDLFHALLPHEHPLAEEDEVDIRDLDDDPFLLSCGGCEPHIRDIYRQAESRLEPAHRIRELGTLLAMVRAGVGVSVVPGLAASMLDTRLVLVPLRQRLKRHLVLTGPLAKPWHPATTALVDALRAEADTA
ncbi:LysR substrate-binding domain-containing protein [Saccharopolyspora sp. K220]|uniref:LysR family transcriptional regulator n=1 Tax=Saccharopolyspora soli TaxID=2926618 RepID=UPI001F57A2AA|nr:LysR substrate-binding domain-containing protein [Saccharopolyspora soli]MCI2416266.1 LysR substrate-binding domain-containing protein [Saccharopolyspora soli]